MLANDAVTALLMGLLGAGHCIGMCGPLSSMMLLNTSHGQSLRLSWQYNLGRLVSYMTAGALAGLVASILPTLLPQWGAAILRLSAALLILLLGLYLLRVNLWIQRLERLGQYAWQRIQPLAKSVLPLKSAKDALLAGVLWGWLPCGLVYSALTYSASSGSMLNGALIMGMFGLGTLPAMLGVALAGRKLQAWLANQWVRYSCGLLMVLLGVLSAIPQLKTLFSGLILVRL